MRSHVRNALVIVFMMVSLSVTAAPPEGSETAPDMPPSEEEGAYQTVVTPGKREQSLFDSDRSVHVINGQQLVSEQPSDVLEAIAVLPGVHVQRTNLGAAAPILRGLVGPRNLIVIDGLRFNNATFRTGPNQYMALLSPDAVGSIEVLLGPGSVLHGSDAMGGVVHLRPRPLPTEDGVHGRMRTQSVTADGSHSLAVDAGWSEGPVHAAFGMGLRDHGSLRTGAGARAPLSAFEQKDGRARIHMGLGEGWSLSAQWWGSRITDASRTDRLGNGDVRTVDNEDHFTWVTLERISTGIMPRIRVSLHHHHTNENALRWRCALGSDGAVLDTGACLRASETTVLQQTRLDDVVDSVGGMIEAEFRPLGDALGLVAGVESVTDFVTSGGSDASATTGFLEVKRERGNFSTGSTHSSLASFVHADVPLFSWVGGGWSMTAGARGTWAEARAPDVPGIGDVRFSDWGVVGTVGSRWILGNQWNLHLNYAQGFRLPNLQESTVLGDTGKNFEIPNADLRSEKSHSGEAGLRWFRPGVQLSVAYSLSLIDDIIVRQDAEHEGASVVDGAPVKQRVNADEAVYHALDGGIRLGPWERTTLFANWLWVHGDVHRAEGEVEPARRVPPLQGRVGARYEAFSDRLHVTIFADWAAAQSRLSPGDEEDLRICGDSAEKGSLLSDCPGTAAWVDPGLQLTWFLDPRLQLNASLRNVTDSLYRHHGSGVDAPGIHARIGLLGRL